MTAVRDWMSTDVAPVGPDATLIDSARQMRSSGVGGVAVVDSASGECVGILTERDIVVRVLAEERDARAALARDVATLDPVTCGPDEDVAEVVRRMREAEVQHIPVLERGRLVGLISLADIAFRRPDEERGTFAPPGG